VKPVAQYHLLSVAVDQRLSCQSSSRSLSTIRSLDQTVCSYHRSAYCMIFSTVLGHTILSAKFVIATTRLPI
jgi:hypothetical protein